MFLGFLGKKYCIYRLKYGIILVNFGKFYMKFEKGQSGNLKGRPKTTDKKLGEAVLKDRLKAYKFVQKAMKEGESWAYEVYFNSLLPAAREIINDSQ